jgi:hypothetical protein
LTGIPLTDKEWYLAKKLRPVLAKQTFVLVLVAARLNGLAANNAFPLCLRLRNLDISTGQFKIEN